MSSVKIPDPVHPTKIEWWTERPLAEIVTLKDMPRNQVLGDIGEYIAYCHFIANGFTYIPGLNHYDSTKDALVDEELTEIKTRMRIQDDNTFSIEYDQLTKLTLCKRVLFVRVPEEGPSPVRLYERIVKESWTRSKRFFDKGEASLIYKIDKLLHVGTIHNEKLSRLMYIICSSGFKRGFKGDIDAWIKNYDQERLSRLPFCESVSTSSSEKAVTIKTRTRRSSKRTTTQTAA